MKTIKFYFILIFANTVMMTSCGQSDSKTDKTENLQGSLPNENPATDSSAIMLAFEKLKTNKKFLKDMALENEKIFSWNDDMVKIIYGDLDSDGISDALLGFTVEGRSGGNNFDIHYAVFLNKDKQWLYQNQFDANAGSTDLFYRLKEIRNGIIIGEILSNNNDDYSVPTEFIFKNKSLINTFTALHKTEIGQREYIWVDEILTPENVSIPLTATLKEYQKLLGNGKITDPDMTMECGIYFIEGEYRELQYPNLIFELSEQKQAAFQTIAFKNSGLKLQTGKGTISADTTLKELQNILHKNDSWWINDGEGDSGKSISIPTGEEADDRWIIRFDNNGNIVSVTLFIPC